MGKLIFDLETNGLLEDVSVIHCLCIMDAESGQKYRFDPVSKPISDGLKMLSEAETIIGHNIIGYDIPVIKKLHPEWTHNRAIDTMVWARCISPDIKDSDFGRVKRNILPKNMIGKHSLEAWGYRLGILKGSYGKTTDWQTWDEDMTLYCLLDVEVTAALYKACGGMYLPESTLEMEMKVAEIIARQERHGFPFNMAKAETLYAQLLGKREKLREELRGAFPNWYAPDTEFTPKRSIRRKTAGGWYETLAEGAPMTKVKLLTFNPSSNQHIAYWLVRKYGWEPQEFTDKTNEAKIDEDIIEALPYEEAPKLAEFLTLNKRCGQIAEGKGSWFKAYNQRTGRIHGAVNTNGAVTTRMTHFSPNMAQVPAGYSPYGKECRELFEPVPGYKQVGCDASSLELCCLAHYLAKWDGGSYGVAVTTGTKEEGTDPHTMNMKALGITSRDNAKTWIYAWLYGAGDANLARQLGVSVKEGKKAKERFLKKLPALKDLKDAIAKKVKSHGFLYALDGRQLKSRSPHSALNLLLQSAGALIMKKALVIFDEEMQRLGHKHSGYAWAGTGYDYEFMANVHDEVQVSVRPELAEEVGKLFAESIAKAGLAFKFKCPLSGDYAAGSNWKETH